MKPKRRKQANYAIGDFLAGFGKAVILGNLRLRHPVKASSKFFKPPLAGETKQVFPRDSVRVKVPDLRIPNFLTISITRSILAFFISYRNLLRNVGIYFYLLTFCNTRPK
jgi:hypothetical protein